MRRIKGLALLGLFFLLLGGCGVVVQPGKEFHLASRDFAQRLRWMDVSGTARHMLPEYAEDYRQRYLGREDLRIVDVRFETIELLEQGREAEARMVVEYYLLPSLNVKKFRFSQHWAYLGGDRYHPGVWTITSPFPPFP
ncbi:hypothetical protein DESUT3_04330 [Desulfuromonas versatilis]|uniref:Lipoprotein n=1 Tax=Desulfuromonas versatilis TaxID=2802975 RepID=A0ABM9SDF5_9BACT|nr:hypothetical protein [Desulfuromonas versatilis]BCR03364.1 hypothetical protein DESUT3_04330 [Desulfuromonas versatilis]